MAYIENSTYIEEVEFVHGQRRGFSTIYMKESKKTIGAYYEADGKRLHLIEYFHKYVSCSDFQAQPYSPKEGHDYTDVISNVLYNSFGEQCYNPGEGKRVTTNAAGAIKVFEFTPSKFTLYMFSAISQEKGFGTLTFKNMKGEYLTSFVIDVNKEMKGAEGFYYGFEGLEWNTNERIEVYWQGAPSKEYVIRRYEKVLK